MVQTKTNYINGLCLDTQDYKVYKETLISSKNITRLLDTDLVEISFIITALLFDWISGFMLFQIT